MKIETITIADSKGAQATIAPALGFNCISFAARPGGEACEVLWTAPDFLAGTGKPSHSGIPLLFPFAGRLRGTSFEYQNRRYELETGDGQGNAIHGFVLNRPWRISGQGADRVSGVFQASVDDSAILKRWPADFRITAEYSVVGNALLADYTVENPDDKPLPFNLGIHPYFRVPLGGTNADECRVRVPVEYAWELTKLLPTGRTDPGPAKDLAAGMRFAAMQLDNVFGGVRFENHRAAATVEDPASRRTMTLSFDDRFTTCVVYNPPHRQAVCIEPYTSVPDPFWLQSQGIDPHLQVLAPGGKFETRVEIRLDQEGKR